MKGVREAVNIHQGQVSLASLNKAYIGSIKAGRSSEILLGHVQISAD